MLEDNYAYKVMQISPQVNHYKILRQYAYVQHGLSF